MLKKYSQVVNYVIVFMLCVTSLILIRRQLFSGKYIEVVENTKIPSMSVLEMENTRRLIKIHETCKKYHLGLYQTTQIATIKYPPTPQYSVFYIDKIHGISYCPIYKAASTTWLYNMCLLMGIDESVLTSGNEQISTIARRVIAELDFPEAEEAMLMSTTKLLVVRHPFERLLSAYRDKLENSRAGREHGTLHFYRKYGVAIVKKYRGVSFTPPKDDEIIRRKGIPQPTGMEPTWREFVNYLIDTDLANYGDDHWMPYYLFCTPCSLNYTIVGKVETLERDQAFAIKKMALQSRIQPRWRHNGGQMNAAKIYFRQLTRDEIYKLYNKFRLDFEMFDYSPEEYYSFTTVYK